MNNIILAMCLLYIFSWIFVIADNIIEDAVNFIKYKVLKIENKPRSYSSVDDMLLKNGKIREFYLIFSTY